MSSLQDIMNVDEDPKTSPRYTDPSTAEGCPPPPTTTSSNTSRHARYISEGDKVTRSEEHQDLRRTSSPAQTSRPSPAGQASTSTTHALASRRPSNTSVDSMDHSYGYGHGHGHHGSPGQYNQNPMMRPFSSSSASAEPPVKLTPITGRVSRAKKGVPVHTCDQCRPAKTFTRAEHLRRHQLSHENPKYPCLLPGCDRAFHRKDLLERHQQRHELEGDKAKSDSYGGSRRTSTGSVEGPSRQTVTGQGYATPSSTPGMSLTPSIPSAVFQTMGSPSSMNKSVSPQMGASEGYRPASTGGQGYNNGYSLSNETSRSPFNIQGAGSTGYETPPSLTAPTFSGPDFSQPRTTPAYSPLMLQTKDLSGMQAQGLDIPPELSFQQDHWPSSATDSPYSTPSENSRSLWPNSQRSTSVEWQPSNMMSPYQNPVAGLDTLPTNVFFPYTTSPPMAAASVFATAYSGLPGFPDENTLLDLHNQHQRFANTVRSTTPPTATTLAQGSDLLVSPSTALSSDRLMGSMACMGRQKDVAAGLLPSPSLMQSSLSSLPVSVSRAIPEYIEVYWREVHDRFPIVHRRSFEDAPGQCEALHYAMAAVATQHLRGREHRIRGQQLHDYAWQQATKSLQMNMSVMQAILLCEMFARFRGRKAAIRPSREFRSVYTRVLDPSVLGAAIPGRGPNHRRWQMWLGQEAQRRLLAACFVLDVHASVYQEQHRVRNLGPTADDILLIPLTTPWDGLWEAPSADAWAALVENNPNPTPTFLHMLDMNSLNSQDIDTYSTFDKSVILAREYLDLQSQTTPTQVMAEPDYQSFEGSIHRIEELFPNCPVANTYLALHHTPLHDLLAVSGESWVFSHKLLQESSFAEQKRRLRLWSNSPKAAAAVGYACRALHAFTSQGNTAGRSDYGAEDSDADEGAMDWDARLQRRWRDDMSDYWSMYVCALICWAFGHRAQAAGSVSPASSFPSDAQSETGALAWLQTMAATQPEHLMECRSKEDTMLVVGLARRWLESDVFERNRLYVDAVRVLRKLEEGVNWKWF